MAVPRPVRLQDSIQELRMVCFYFHKIFRCHHQGIQHSGHLHLCFQSRTGTLLQIFGKLYRSVERNGCDSCLCQGYSGFFDCLIPFRLQFLLLLHFLQLFPDFFQDFLLHLPLILLLILFVCKLLTLSFIICTEAPLYLHAIRYGLVLSCFLFRL